MGDSRWPVAIALAAGLLRCRLPGMLLLMACLPAASICAPLADPAQTVSAVSASRALSVPVPHRHAAAAGLARSRAARGLQADYDIVIRHGEVLDGTGAPAFQADVAIKNGRIVRVGTFPGVGAREIDASGLYVAPGFIDMMDQSGSILRWHGAAQNKLRMGVTTLIAGEGGTPVPADQISAYFRELQRRGIGVNFGTYYRGVQARIAVMGMGAGSPTPTQIDRMRSLVATAMRAGVFGVSSALVYPPDSFQSTSDLIALASVAGRCDGFYATHLRDEGEGLLKAIDEAIEIGEQAKVKVEIFHFKAAWAPEFGRLMPEAIAKINAARARGVDIAADMYPYTAAGTGLDITVPNHLFARGRARAYRLLRSPSVRAALKREVATGSEPGWSNFVRASGGWQHIVLANAFNPRYRRFRGQSFAAIGRALHEDPADAAWDILLAALPHRALALYFMMDEADVETALKQPWVSIGSDAAAAARLGQLDAMGLPHPRAYGTFPRVIAEYVRDRHVLTLPEAIRKMTGWPAERMGLTDRGVIRKGMRADVVIFDYNKIQDMATWTHPTALPKGIDYVIVNGRIEIDRGRYTGVRNGLVLRHQCDI